MNAKLRVAMLSLSVVMLSACTTTGGMSRAAPKESPMTDEERYVAQVERLARTRGIEVVWINRPLSKANLIAVSDE